MVCPHHYPGSEGLSPAWHYRCRHEEFNGHTWPYEDPGLSLANFGVFVLFLVHFTFIYPMSVAVARDGFDVAQCLWLLPLIALWGFLGAADIRFRFLGANRDQRLGFD